MVGRIVMIIGNGFDLDVGLKTSYRNYFDSGALNKYRNQEIVRSLYTTRAQQNWIDIEEFFRGKSMSMTASAASFILEAFDYVRETLLDYIKNLSYESLRDNPTAIQILREVLRAGDLKIFNFNYTDLHKICDHYNLSLTCEPISIHGKASDNSIIFGFDDNANPRSPECCQMIKSHSKHCFSANINEALENADEVIFFGHSLGITDYHYFSDFFLSQTKSQHKEKFRKKIIRIFTYDERSRQQILLQLREMNDHKTNLLYDLNDFGIYRTLDDKTKIQKYCHALKSRIDAPII